MKADGSKEFGLIEFTDGVKGKLNEISAREDADTTIVTDPFTNTDEGKAIQITKDSTVKDKKNTYKVSLLWEKNVPLSDEELQELQKLDSLESMFKDSYKRSDYTKALKGLEIFDNKNGFGIFEHDDFLDICEEIDKYYPENEEEVKSETDKDTKEEVKEEKSEEVKEDEKNEEVGKKVENEGPFKEDEKENGKEKPKSRIEVLKEKHQGK